MEEMRLVLEFVALFGLFTACIWASYTDITTRKSPNLCTVGLAGFGLICQILFLLLGVGSITQIVALVLIALIISLTLYRFGLWSAGDGKLYLGVSLAIPPTLSLWNPVNFAPVAILINTFLGYGLVLFGISLLKTSLKQKVEVLKSVLSLKVWFEIVYNSVCFLGIVYSIASVLPPKFRFIYSFILVIALFWVVRKYVEQKYLSMFLFPFFMLAVWFAREDIGGFVKMLIVMMCVYILPRLIALGFGKVAYSLEVGIEELKPGIVPAEVIVRGVTEDGTQIYQKIDSSQAKQSEGDVLFGISAWGLTEEQVVGLKGLSAEGVFEGFGNRLMIQQTIPFAPVMLFGVMLTLLFGGSFIWPLAVWLKKVF